MLASSERCNAMAICRRLGYTQKTQSDSGKIAIARTFATYRNKLKGEY